MAVPREDEQPKQVINGVIERLLALREKEAPLGYTGYRGPFTQEVIAQIAGVPVKTVTRMAIEREKLQLSRQTTGFEIVDSCTVRDADGRDHDVLESIDALPWVSQLCSQMPHEYAHKFKSNPHAYAVVERMLKASNPESCRAYFRGYQSPNRYWEAPDGAVTG